MQSTSEPGTLIGFLLLREYGNGDWSIVQSLHDGDDNNLSEIGRPPMSIRGDTFGVIGSVAFMFNNEARNEANPPYSLGGINGTHFNPVPHLSEPGIKKCQPLPTTGEEL